MGEVLRGRILSDVLADTALTEPDLTVLVHLRDAGGTLRQNALVRATGWDRSRLSHVLTRMEERGLVERSRLANGVDVTVRRAGREALAATSAPLGVAVERHFMSRLSPSEKEALRRVTDALSD